MKKKDWQPLKKIEVQYQRSLEKIHKLILSAVKNLSSGREIENALYRVYESKDFQDLVKLVAKKFVTSANIENERTWRKAAASSSRGKEIYSLLSSVLERKTGITLDQKIADNAKYISSLPLSLAKSVNSYVASQQLKGIRAEEISGDIGHYVSRLSRSRIALIARTEASKTMSALTQARAQDVGVNWYIWVTADDTRVRKSHNHMDNILVNWNDPPSPEALIGVRSVGHYNAGEIYNCRCFPRPLVSLDNVKWPAKVYHNNAIRTMTKAQFLKIA